MALKSMSSDVTQSATTAMNEAFLAIQSELVELFDALKAQFFSVMVLWQVLAIIAGIAFGYLLSRYPVAQLNDLAKKKADTRILFRLYTSIRSIFWPLISVIFLWIATTMFSRYGLPNDGLRIVASLLNTWIVVRLISVNMSEGFWNRLLSFLAWTIAALYILRLIDPVTDALSAIEIPLIGISLLRLLTGAIVAGLALWLGGMLGDVAQKQLRGSRTLTPSMAGLLGQVIKIALMVFAVLIALEKIGGVNLASLTIFSGALGVGIGFGLQKIFSNFVSGIIILLEKSVKVGDFIELQSGVTGTVKEINIRSTLITTNDNVDILVPNEEFINAQVTSWTLREKARRTRVPFGVAYGADKDIVRKAVLEAAAAVQWTYDDGAARKPQVWLVEFGDSSLNFELVVWLKDEAVARPAKVLADYNWEIHTALQKYDIEIPFPQRDINFRNSEPVRVQIERE